MDTKPILNEIRSKLEKSRSIKILLGNSYERPLKSIDDGYPEIAISLIYDALLKIFSDWATNHHINKDSLASYKDGFSTLGDIPEDSKAVYKLIQHLFVRIDNQKEDIYNVNIKSTLEIFRDFVEILNILEKEDTEKDTTFSIKPEIKSKLKFLIELLGILKFKLFKYYQLKDESVYLLFQRKKGIKYEYSEIFVSDNIQLLDELSKEMQSILTTSYPLTTSLVITDNYSIIKSKSRNVYTLDTLIGKYLNFKNYIEHIYQSNFFKISQSIIPLKGELLSYSGDKQDYIIDEVGDVDEIIDEFINSPQGNLFAVSKAGGGKTALCKRIFDRINTKEIRKQYALYYDLSKMEKNDTIENFITAYTTNYFNINSDDIFDFIYFLSCNGKLILILDGLDEIFDKINMNDILYVFSEISKLFTENSKIIITSRQSFLMSSKQIGELLDRNAVVTEKINYGLNNVGVDPLQLPNFKILKLQDINLSSEECSLKHNRIYNSLKCNSDIYISPIQYQLINNISVDKSIQAFNPEECSFIQAKLIYSYITSLSKSIEKTTFSKFIRYFYRAYQMKVFNFSLIDIFSTFGNDLFEDGILALDYMKLQALFIETDNQKIRFRHKNYYEFLFALGYMMNTSIEFSNKELFITDEIRAFIYEISSDPSYFDLFIEPNRNDRILRKGLYIIGDYDKAQIIELNKVVIFDEFPVTVKEYNDFLDYANKNDVSCFQHPQQPADISHLPKYNKLKIADYYSNPEYESFPAVCISWWSAYAFAKYAGKRLPTAVEWECAGRGKYGNLFPWGNKIDIKYANSADYWANKLLISYDNWKNHYDHDKMLRGGSILGVDLFPKNISPIGIRNMAGNVWEFTATTNETMDKAVICGGSYDNPFRAMKCATRGLADIIVTSNVVGFRCCKTLDIS